MSHSDDVRNGNLRRAAEAADRQKRHLSTIARELVVLNYLITCLVRKSIDAKEALAAVEHIAKIRAEWIE